MSETFTYKDQILEIIDTLELETDTDKSILKSRFLGEVLNYEKRKDHTKKYYNIFRFIVTTGSILLPAVLSMGQMDPAKLPKNFDDISYWFSWTISLLVTGSNGFLQLFSLDKNYFNYSMVVEQLKTEGWQYFGLSGKYEDYPNHQSAYKSFSKSVESIKRKQVEQDFQNGKGENKKKKFDFQGEMKKFAEEQNANLKIKDAVVEQILPQKEIVNKAVELIPTVKDELPDIPSIPDPEKVAEILKEETKGVIDETIDKA